MQQESTVLYDYFYPLVKDNALKNKETFSREVVKFIDKNASNLFVVGPTKRVYFGKKDREIVFNTLGITEKQILEGISKAPGINPAWRLLNDTIHVAFTMLCLVYSQENATKAAELAKIYFCLKMYSANHLIIFHYLPNERIMEYTINNLSNKYIIKTMKNMYEVVKHIAVSNDTLIMKDIISTHADSKIVYYITNMNTKVRGILKNIYREYVENNLHKRYLNEESEKHEDDKLRDMENISTIITSGATKIYSYMKNGSLDERILREATKRTAISFNSSKYALISVLENETEKLKEMITLILQYFLTNNHKVNTIKTVLFYKFNVDAFSISNTKDPTILRMKELLNIWLSQYSEAYTKTNREATKINFKKTIFIYLILFIAKNFKGQ